MVCNKQLSTGEELYVIDENKFVCKDDYLSSSSLKEGSLNSGRRPPLLHGPRPQRPGTMRGQAALYFAPCGSPVPNPAPAHSQGSSRARKGPGVWGRDTAFFRSQSYRTPERSVLLQFKNLFQSCHRPPILELRKSPFRLFGAPGGFYLHWEDTKWIAEEGEKGEDPRPREHLHPLPRGSPLQERRALQRACLPFPRQ